MNSLNSTISTHQKGQHLALTDRVTLQVLRSQGQFLRQVAASPNCSPTNVKYELERGQISWYHGKGTLRCASSAKTLPVKALKLRP